MARRAKPNVAKWLLAGGLGVGTLLLISRRSFAAAAQGTPLRLWNTYYKLADETQFSSAPEVAMRDSAGNVIAMVSHAFMRDFCMEGSGKLRDGRVVNISRADPPYCRASVLDAVRFPWGSGVRNRVLRPLKSIAVDPRTIPYGSSVYIREFDGLVIPRVGELGGFTHDGCFVADDTGGAIRGAHIDIFAGTSSMWRALERLKPTRSTLTAFVNSGRCT